MEKLHVKKGDTVVVVSGDDKGLKGEVLETSPKEGKVIVEGVNVITKHVKPTRVGQQGGIVKAAAPLYACKVQLVCPECKKPTRIAHKFEADGDKVNKLRVCKKCGKSFK